MLRVRAGAEVPRRSADRRRLSREPPPPTEHVRFLPSAASRRGGRGDLSVGARKGGQGDTEGGATAHLALHGDVPSHRGDNAAADREAQPRALSHRLGRSKMRSSTSGAMPDPCRSRPR